MELGGGSTITWATTGATKAVTAVANSIGGHTMEVPVVSSTHLASTAETSQMGDLVEYGEFSVEAQWDGTKDAPALGVSETVTITYGAGGTVIGTGFIRSVKFPDAAQNQPQVAEVITKWDGATPPAFTKYT